MKKVIFVAGLLASACSGTLDGWSPPITGTYVDAALPKEYGPSVCQTRVSFGSNTARVINRCRTTAGIVFDEVAEGPFWRNDADQIEIEPIYTSCKNNEIPALYTFDIVRDDMGVVSGLAGYQAAEETEPDSVGCMWGTGWQPTDMGLIRE